MLLYFVSLGENEKEIIWIKKYLNWDAMKDLNLNRKSFLKKKSSKIKDELYLWKFEFFLNIFQMWWKIWM